MKPMEEKWKLVFDEVMISQLKGLARDNNLKNIISRLLDKIELLGPFAGKLLDSKLHIYEVKNLRPPIRLYFKIIEYSQEVYVFEYEMKTSKGKQKNTINKIRLKS